MRLRAVLDSPDRVAAEAGFISLAAWRGYGLYRLATFAQAWSTIGLKRANVGKLAAPARQLLEDVMFHDVRTFALARYSKTVQQAAVQLATQGWLMPITDRPAVTLWTSPLLRRLGLRALATDSPLSMLATRPFDCRLHHQDYGEIVAIALPRITASVMRRAASASLRVGAPALGARNPKRAPTAATYRSQLFCVLRRWYAEFNYADVYDRIADDSADDNDAAADLLIIERPLRYDNGDDVRSPLKRIVTCVASNRGAIERQFGRSARFMTTNRFDRGTCIVFTAVSKAADVVAVDESKLVWPAALQLAAGLEAVHVLHDTAWTRAVVITRGQAGGDLVKRAVSLPLPA